MVHFVFICACCSLSALIFNEISFKVLASLNYAYRNTGDFECALDRAREWHTMLPGTSEMMAAIFEVRNSQRERPD